jgi:deoxyribose-phosphate aldolase
VNGKSSGLSAGAIDREELVRRITREVMARLASGAAAPARTAPDAAVPQTAPACATSARAVPSWSAGSPVHSESACDTCGEGCGLCVVHRPATVRKLIEAGAERLSTGPGVGDAHAGLAAILDHTLLRPEATGPEIEALCAEANAHGFGAVCVNPWYVPLASRLLSGTGVHVASVVGFPLGATLPEVKEREAAEAVREGATELDMVQNIGALKSKDYRLVEEDIRRVVAAAGAGVVVKVILETALLNREEKIQACTLARAAGAHFVKTSTGFSKGGATVEDVRLMREVVGPEMGVKAAGGIRDYALARELIEAGATRLGCSACVRILAGRSTPAAAGPVRAGTS